MALGGRGGADTVNHLRGETFWHIEIELWLHLLNLSLLDGMVGRYTEWFSGTALHQFHFVVSFLWICSLLCSQIQCSLPALPLQHNPVCVHCWSPQSDSSISLR